MESKEVSITTVLDHERVNQEFMCCLAENSTRFEFILRETDI